MLGWSILLNKFWPGGDEVSGAHLFPSLGRDSGGVSSSSDPTSERKDLVRFRERSVCSIRVPHTIRKGGCMLTYDLAALTSSNIFGFRGGKGQTVLTARLPRGSAAVQHDEVARMRTSRINISFPVRINLAPESVSKRVDMLVEDRLIVSATQVAQNMQGGVHVSLPRASANMSRHILDIFAEFRIRPSEIGTCHIHEVSKTNHDAAISTMEGGIRWEATLILGETSAISMRAGIQSHMVKVPWCNGCLLPFTQVINNHYIKARKTSSAKWRCDKRVRPASISLSISHPRHVCTSPSYLPSKRAESLGEMYPTWRGRHKQGWNRQCERRWVL